jgi:hypothetical protein
VLTSSAAYHGTLEVSCDPVTLGAGYRESGPFGVRNGRVAEFERPTAITFHQPMRMPLHAGIADVVMRYTLTPGDGITHVRRLVTLGIPWSLKLARPVLVREFRRESSRTLLALKAYAGTLARLHVCQDAV